MKIARDRLRNRNSREPRRYTHTQTRSFEFHIGVRVSTFHQPVPLRGWRGSDEPRISEFNSRPSSAIYRRNRSVTRALSLTQENTGKFSPANLTRRNSRLVETRSNCACVRTTSHFHRIRLDPLPNRYHRDRAKLPLLSGEIPRQTFNLLPADC